MFRPPIQLPQIEFLVDHGDRSILCSGRWTLSLSTLNLPQSFSVTSPKCWISRDMRRYIFTDKQQTHNSELHCVSCKAFLGTADVSAEGWKVYKSSVSLKPSLKTEWEDHSPEIFIASQLLALINSSAARKFIMHTSDTKQGFLVSRIAEDTVKEADHPSIIGLGL
jgi:HECT-like Ubiquitin-conjugating enzyme (E2)-binding